jgi:hypothetical protein
VQASAPFLWFLSQNQPKESSPTGRSPFPSPHFLSSSTYSTTTPFSSTTASIPFILSSPPACSSSSPIEVSRRYTSISHIGQAPLLQPFLQRPQTQQHRSSLLGSIFFFGLLNSKRPKQQPEANPTATPPSRPFSLGAAYHPKRKGGRRKPKKDLW